MLYRGIINNQHSNRLKIILKTSILHHRDMIRLHNPAGTQLLIVRQHQHRPRRQHNRPADRALLNNGRLWEVKELLRFGWHGESQQTQQDIYNQQMRGEISGGYDAYFASLNAQLEGVPDRQASQEGIVGSQYTQGVADLEADKAMGARDLAAQRTRAQSSQLKLG